MNAGNDRYHLILGGNIVKIIFWAEQNNLVTDVCYIPIADEVQCGTWFPVQYLYLKVTKMSLKESYCGCEYMFI